MFIITEKQKVHGNAYLEAVKRFIDKKDQLQQKRADTEANLADMQGELADIEKSLRTCLDSSKIRELRHRRRDLTDDIEDATAALNVDIKLAIMALYNDILKERQASTEEIGKLSDAGREEIERIKEQAKKDIQAVEDALYNHPSCVASRAAENIAYQGGWRVLGWRGGLPKD